MLLRKSIKHVPIFRPLYWSLLYYSDNEYRICYYAVFVKAVLFLSYFRYSFAPYSSEFAYSNSIKWIAINKGRVRIRNARNKLIWRWIWRRRRQRCDVLSYIADRHAPDNPRVKVWIGKGWKPLLFKYDKKKHRNAFFDLGRIYFIYLFEIFRFLIQ